MELSLKRKLITRKPKGYCSQICYFWACIFLNTGKSALHSTSDSNIITPSVSHCQEFSSLIGEHRPLQHEVRWRRPVHACISRCSVAGINNRPFKASILLLPVAFDPNLYTLSLDGILEMLQPYFVNDLRTI